MHRFKSTSDSQASYLQAQLKLEREKSENLQRRIESLEAEQSLFQERESALLDIISRTTTENMEKLSEVIVRSEETHTPVSVSQEVLDIFLDGNRLLAELPRISEDFAQQVLALRNLCSSDS
ncbi:hypothetical protein B9Z19DRAFT_1133717 [Tuber borchii]|uniref:Uncharacterized protein n=1 Tax=Tuber borchii TaxID=42251 RepID=A0A2T6ZFF1_TUBBO|nr:hypothetical protein B9Z19DRAFT_1133717 [Tuber borchii]